MADISSKTITDLNLAAPELGEAGKIAGNVKVKIESWVEGTVASGGNGPIATADVMRFFRVNSSEIPIQILIYHDDYDSATCTVDIGLYDIKGGAAVDASVFGSAHSLAETGITMDTLNFSQTGIDPLSISSHAGTAYVGRIWQHLGLSSDPQKDYDFTFLFNQTPDQVLTFLSVVYLYVDEG